MAMAAVACMAGSAQASLVYADDLRNGRFTTFDTLTPGTQTNIVASGFTNNYFGMDFNASATTLYAVKTVSNVTSLETLNLGTGAVSSSINVTGLDAAHNVTGLTIGADNTAYLSASGTGNNYNLYNLNLSTGAASLIGSMGTNIIIDIAINATGQMVAHDITTDSFHFVNTATGALTLIGAHGLAANFAQGMDFDFSNGQLYAAVYTGGGTLTYGTVNLATGQVTSIPGIVSGEYEMAIAAAVPEPGTMIALGAGALALLRRRAKKN
jgi:hypothetical protein